MAGVLRAGAPALVVYVRLDVDLRRDIDGVELRLSLVQASIALASVCGQVRLVRVLDSQRCHSK